MNNIYIKNFFKGIAKGLTIGIIGTLFIYCLIAVVCGVYECVPGLVACGVSLVDIVNDIIPKI